jgi:hypothetical protein
MTKSFPCAADIKLLHVPDLLARMLHNQLIHKETVPKERELATPVDTHRLPGRAVLSSPSAVESLYGQAFGRPRDTAAFDAFWPRAQEGRDPAKGVRP